MTGVDFGLADPLPHRSLSQVEALGDLTDGAVTALASTVSALNSDVNIYNRRIHRACQGLPPAEFEPLYRTEIDLATLTPARRTGLRVKARSNVLAQRSRPVLPSQGGRRR
ncbi:hypothetical protein [Nonomuraea turcica]|uniref:hypothetical protein n=1 Tax=Nonomuraea sp. G32 TaxID=3067274 RepID=UPI00273C6A10|nr:hypothetical protein [Nonomuraea sp. G32]MDP4511940.1 hypothetical protein [Nonomuraea sp. G32]